MCRKWLKSAGLFALQIALYLPLYSAVQARRPVSVDIGLVAPQEQEKLGIRALDRLARRYPRASEVKAMWQVKTDSGKIVPGSLTFNRREDNRITFKAASIPEYMHGPSFFNSDETIEETIRMWAKEGKINGRTLGRMKQGKWVYEID